MSALGLICGIVGFTLLIGCGATTRSSTDDNDTSTSSSGGTGGSGGLPGVAPAWLTCSEPSDCTVTFSGCCPECGEASVDNSIAIAKSSVETYRADACGEASVCTGCFSIANSYLQAACIEGSCTLVDVNTPPFVSCSESSDCILRSSTCCACYDPAGRIAIAAASEAAYTELVCDEHPICPECAGGGEVTDLDALCHEGRCIVRSFEF